MIWYKYLYLGETAKKHRFSILQKLRLGKVQPGVHVITPASGGHNLLDILPAYVLRQNYYREQADLLIVGGTSLNVYPAAGLINYYRGHKLVLINKSATPLDSRANLVIQAPIGEVFSAVC